MTDDIVTELRKADCDCELCWDETFHTLNQRAADEIERLRTQLWQARTGNALLQLEKERAICDRLYKLLYSGVWSTTDPEINMELAKAVSDYEELRHNPQPQREVIKDDC